ncbi:Hsp20 family protein [sulfur-oxidizing endosymbiont of Gigantopelta aegis]|uniref:Hsp20 family protein n=1 Tax=sulfur-oxidizing endosymbiont of Gigantopelta aegis TaxID=2794934 RepID=UPI0018DD9624|nr:Hsp20 family protein [sulfur-oxidizing endosymbiont of Gigantopelta aegis]
MNTFDFAPLFRSAVGFDHLYSKLDRATRTAQSQPSYPPYNIELIDEDSYRITMALAGFNESQLNIKTESNVLTITGDQDEQKDAESRQYLHRGIAARNFEHRFQLAEHVKVTSASLVNGLLNIELVREIPEAMKPHTISINTSADSNPQKLKSASIKAA